MSRSIQQLPNNSGTTSVTEVYTSTGFNAGDPVYFQSGDYKNPANLTPPSTVNFDFAAPAAINPNGVGGIITPAFSYAQMQTGISGGTSRKFAAVLTNGNIVQVWTNYTPAPSTPHQVYFRIVDSTNTVVVAPTSVSATFTNSSYSAVSVVALIGGGFAVGWINSSGGTSNSVNYAIYSNLGIVVTAATQDTSFSLGGSYVPIEMTSLANGGFAIAAKNTATEIFLRAYNATGVGAYATIATGIFATAVENSFALTARSDSSVFICDRFNTSTYYYRLYNSAGSAIIGITQFTTPGGTASAALGVGGPDASVQADGTTIVIGFNSSDGTNGYPAFRFLPLSNTISAQTIAIPVSNLFYRTSYAGGYLSLQCLSSGNFILYFSDGYGNMQYAFYNSSGVCVSGSNGTGAIPTQVTGGFAGRYSKVTLIESGGFVNAYWTSATNQQKPVNQVFCKISTSNYAIQPVSSTTGPSVVVTGQPAGASIPSTVNPNSLSFYSTANSATVVTNTPSTVSGPAVISATSCDAIASCTLPNGNFVVVWRASSGLTIYANVYSSSGSLIFSQVVATSGGAAAFSVRVAALSGGGFVVAYTSTSNAVATLQVYSSGYAPTSSVNINTASYATNINFDISGMTDNNFVFVYSQDGSSIVYANVYNSSLTLLSQINTTALAQSLTVAGNHHGGFAVCGWYGGAGTGYFQPFVPTAPNTWTSVQVGSFGMSAFIQNPQLCATESGMYIYTNYESAYPDYVMFTDTGPTTVPSTAALTSWPLGSADNPTSYPMMGIGLTGNGNVVIATAFDSTQIGIACLPAQMTFSSGQPLPYQTSSNGTNVNMFSNNAYKVSGSFGNAAQPRITSGVGNNCVLTFLNTSRFPTILIINGTSVSNAYPIVAGVTPSALTPIAPATTSANIAGVFAGVAITSATAGSTGQLANNGQVLLGASYTSTAAGAFDSTGAAVSGVKGTFNGRSVNLQGNS